MHYGFRFRFHQTTLESAFRKTNVPGVTDRRSGEGEHWGNRAGKQARVRGRVDWLVPVWGALAVVAPARQWHANIMIATRHGGFVSTREREKEKTHKESEERLAWNVIGIQCADCGPSHSFYVTSTFWIQHLPYPGWNWCAWPSIFQVLWVEQYCVSYMSPLTRKCNCQVRNSSHKHKLSTRHKMPCISFSRKWAGILIKLATL